MTVKEIVKEYLLAKGFEGLYADECSCEVSDLMPCFCCEGSDGCEPGYKSPCDPETCPADGDCEWHIGPKGDKT